MSQRILTRAKFKAWLESKKPMEVVGIRQESLFCPLAEFLTKEYANDADCIAVGEDLIEMLKDGDVRGFTTPRWAIAFMHKIDASPVRRITAARALEILEGCK